MPTLESYLKGPFDIPASYLRDGDWIAARVQDSRRRWGIHDDRVAATLWWYSSGSTLVLLPIATGIITGIAAAPALSDGAVWLTEEGTLGGVHTARFVDLVDRFDSWAAELASSIGAVVDVLAEVSGVRVPTLWALATDSIANRALDAGAAVGDRGVGVVFARRLIEEMRAPMPNPRFVNVLDRVFTERCSCCLLYLVPGMDKCTSCPRRTPSSRRKGWEDAARAGY